MQEEKKTVGNEAHPGLYSKPLDYSQPFLHLASAQIGITRRACGRQGIRPSPMSLFSPNLEMTHIETKKKKRETQKSTDRQEWDRAISRHVIFEPHPQREMINSVTVLSRGQGWSILEQDQTSGTSRQTDFDLDMHHAGKYDQS